jgi:imidazolonepropionase-like amidohydrolase
MPTLLLALALLAQDRVLITGALLLDPILGGAVDSGRSLLIADGRIQKVLARDAPAPEGARRLDLTGFLILPGLIDLHTHVTLRPYDQMSWEDQVHKESLELRAIRATAAARATLEAGFTTIRDLGTEGAGLADVALRDAITQGIVPGPRILATTRAIVRTGCYDPLAAQAVEGVDGVRRAVREQAAAGADWIKVYADYRCEPGKPARPAFTLEELQALVEEARGAGLRVAAHATTDEGIRRAVAAGAATIEHGTGASDGTLKLMKERGAVLCPTLAASEAMARYAKQPERRRESLEAFARARRAGVTIACGSDAGVFAHGTNLRELELMVEGGMDVVDALRTATEVASEVLGRKDLGCFAPGGPADLVVCRLPSAQPDRRFPSFDLAALRSPAMVWKDGRIVVDRR